MSAKILDGKQLAAEVRGRLKVQVAQFQAETNRQPCLAAVLVGADPASEVYVRNKRRDCEKVGIASRLEKLSAETTQEQLLALIADLNTDDDVNGILVQLPLPAQIEEQKVLDAIDPLKDVDAFHPENVGRLAQGRPRFLPCTPHGCQQILARHKVETAGKHAVVVGRSEIVGKPVALLLMQRDSSLGPNFANATVTVCHSQTPNLGEITRQADVLIAAIGRANFITAEMVKPGAAVVDVGINRTEDGLVGDVDFAGVSEVASHITPVPGGVGPLTRAMLLVNTLTAAKLQL